MKNLPACTARPFLRRTKSGQVIKVRLSTPSGLTWRTYRMPLGLDQAVTAALRSAGIPEAFAWLRLPLPMLPPGTAGEPRE
jgi:hypothetical protein